MLALDKLQPSVSYPNKDRSRLHTRIVHIGFGAFHRAHQAVCAHDLAQDHDSDFGRDLPANDIFIATLIDAYTAIAEKGIKAALDEWVSVTLAETSR